LKPFRRVDCIKGEANDQASAWRCKEATTEPVGWEKTTDPLRGGEGRMRSAKGPRAMAVADCEQEPEVEYDGDGRLNPGRHINHDYHGRKGQGERKQ
jgi:hypothetical protein